MIFIKSRFQVVYNKISTKQVVFFTIVFILFTALVLPFVAAETTRLIGVSESPDTSFSFNVEKIFSIIDSYGASGRRIYVIVRWTFDIVWPLIYTLFLGSSIAYLARRSSCRFTYKPLYFVLLAVLFDLLENINATILMLIHPKEPSFIAYLLIFSSIIKWMLIGLSFLILMLMFVRFIVAYTKKTLLP